MKLKKYTIGLFFRELSDMYQLEIINNIFRVASEYDINIICFSGGFTGKDGRNSETLLFDIAGTRNIDGLIVISSAIFNTHNAVQTREFFNRYAPLPVVSIGLAVSGYSSVTVDSHSGFQKLIEHLFIDHSYRHPLFIKGPQGHLEADERYDIFCSVIEKNILAVDKPVVLKGDFSIQAGRELILDYMSRHSPDEIDIVIASNDNMALGVMQAFSTLSIRVPNDIAVTGFDNNIESTYILPNLTTVNQPMDRVSEIAVKQILSLINGGKTQNIAVPTRFIRRQSCGCLMSVIEEEQQKGGSNRKTSFSSVFDKHSVIEEVEDILSHRPEIAALISRQKEVAGFSLSEFLNRLRGDVNEETYASAYSYFVSVYYHNLIESEYLFEANSIVLEVKHTLSAIEFEAETKNRYLSKISNIELFAVNCIKQTLLNHKIENERKFVDIQRSISLLTDSSDIYQLMGIAGQIARELAFSRCYISLFEQTKDFPSTARLFLSYQNGKTNIPGKMGIPFQTRELFPHDSIDPKGHFLLVMKPLIFQEEYLGFILFEMNAREDISYIDSLSLHLSSAVKSVMMMEKLKNREKHLKTEVERKTRQLRNLNEQLQNDINERKVLEKGILQISSRERERIGSDIHDVVCQNLAGISMMLTAQVHAMDEKKGLELEEIIDTLNETIVETRQIARGYFNISLREDGLIPTVKDYMSKLSELHKIKWDFSYDSGLEIADAEIARHLYYLIQEAVLNALKHADPDKVSISLRKEQNLLILEVSDDGCGLPGNFMERKGLGFHLMQYRANIISGKFSACKNSTGGTSIFCSLPLQTIMKEGI